MTEADHYVFKELLQICREHLNLSVAERGEARRAEQVLEWAWAQVGKFEERHEKRMKLKRKAYLEK